MQEHLRSVPKLEIASSSCISDVLFNSDPASSFIFSHQKPNISHHRREFHSLLTMATIWTSFPVETFSERAIVVFVATFAVALASFGPKAISIIRLASIPYVGSEFGSKEKRRVAYLQGARNLYHAGYEKVRNGPFCKDKSIC